jgi:hypothetical protein
MDNMEDILAMTLSHEIDRDILKQICEHSGLEKSKIKEKLSFMDMKFEDKLYRATHSLTNEDIHRYYY